MKKLSGLVFCVLCFGSLTAQKDVLSELSFYADAMVHASKAENRIHAADEFNQRFIEYLRSPESLSNPLSDLPWISVVVPQDSAFRMITWQLAENETYKYFGVVQVTASNSLIILNDTRSLKSESGTHNQDTWYGGLYYGIQHFVTADKTNAYVVLGFNADTKQINQRVADILTIAGDEVTFGMPVFFINDTVEVKNRIVMNYSDAASATMRFDREKEQLIYDHVITITTPEGPALVPDGSYHGFEYKKGMWHFIDMVFNVKVDEPPGGRPAQKEKRDLFGREVKKD